MLKIRFLLILLFITSILCLAQENDKMEQSTNPNPPEGMIFIPGGSFEMGITTEDLEELV